mgnify:CR=1 FL=1
MAAFAPDQIDNPNMKINNATLFWRQNPQIEKPQSGMEWKRDEVAGA